ncbi:twitching motility protein (pilT) [Anaplasma capra]|nr:twitching motility protein (pilT) [Anaplasma capra]MCU7612460.1 twitching motility protein (pilT) [Anaplasma capra]
MGYLKQLVASSVQHNASHLYCVVGQPPAIKRLGHIEFLQARKIEKEDIENIISGVLPTEAQAALHSTGEASTSTAFDETHSLSIHAARDISRPESETKITICIKELVLPSEGDVPQELICTVMSASRGVILLGGAAHHNKDATVRFLLHKIASTQRKHILTFGFGAIAPAGSSNSIISSYSLSQANFSFIKNQAADILAFPELDHNLARIARDCAATGILTIAAIDSVSTPCMLERVIALFPDRTSGINFLSSHVLGTVMQALLTKGPCIYIYDFIKFEDKVREVINSGNTALVEDSGMVEQINKLIDENKLTYSDAQPILAHIAGGTGAQYTNEVNGEF